MAGSKLWTALKFARTHGIRETIDYAVFRITEEAYERRFGIATSQVAELSEFGIFDKSLREYRPLAYLTIRRILKALPASHKSGEFLDFGSGMGRILIMAARQGFRVVTGIELIDQLNAIAKRNIESAERFTSSAKIRTVTIDASKFEIPDDARLFFFYNPFGGDVLAKVFSNIRASLKQHPRNHTVVFVRPPGTGSGWVGTQDWLVEDKRFRGYRDEEIYFYSVKDGGQ